MKLLTSTVTSAVPSAGGGDSDVMLDMLIRVGAKDKTSFVFCNTGLEYSATHQHLKELEDKYHITIKRFNAPKAIPTCVKQYGVPFWSKYVSEMMYRLQYNGFKWENEPFDVLIKKYPSCKTALRWWCNESTCNMYRIDRSPLLKEFIMANPPTFKISNKCCEYAKKKITKDLEKTEKYDLFCTGVRKAEGGIRASHKTCFDERNSGSNHFRPVFWLSDKDKKEYCDHYGITHSKCYTHYGLVRTGCVGCPFAKDYEGELNIIEQYEPNLAKAAKNIFKDSYDYTQEYLKYRSTNQKKEAIL